MDPKFAKAYASYAMALIAYANNYARDSEQPVYAQRARNAALKAIELTPDLGESNAARARVKERLELDFPGATRWTTRARWGWHRTMPMFCCGPRIRSGYGIA